MNKNNKVAIIVTANFEREAKKLLKKYPSLKQEFFDLSEKLRHNPGLGVKLSHNVYKIRVAVKSKGKGKRGGLRMITYVVLNKLEEYWYPYLTLYETPKYIWSHATQTFTSLSHFQLSIINFQSSILNSLPRSFPIPATIIFRK